MNKTAQAYVLVQIDPDASPVWRDALESRYPLFARSLEQFGAAVIREAHLIALEALESYDGSPRYSESALVSQGFENGPALLAGPYGVFDVLR